MESQAVNIVNVLSKPWSQRTAFQKCQLSLFLYKLTFFSQYFCCQSEQISQLCFEANLVKLEANQDLYGSQQQPDYLYIVISGELEIQSKCSKIVRKAKPYELIGHVQLVFNLAERVEKITAIIDSNCMSISRQSFTKVWQKRQQEQLKRAYYYLRSNKYFQQLQNDEKYKLALMMIKNQFKQGEVIISNGAFNDKILYIICGKFYVIQKLTIGGREKQVIVEDLGQMDCFGEFYAIHGLASQVNVKAMSNGAYYSVALKEIGQSNHGFVELVKKKGLPYPKREELQWRFQVQAQAEKYYNLVKKKLRLYT